jgi:hypothetical protein
MDSAASAPGLPMLGRDPPIPPIPPNHIGECGAPGCPGMRYPDCVNLSNGGVGPPPWYGATCWSWLCSEVDCGNGEGCWCEVDIDDALAQSRPALAPPEPEYPLPFVPRSGWVSADPPAALRSLRSYIRGADSPPSADLGAREGSVSAAEMTDLVRALHLTGRISDAADASDEAEAAAIACAISASSAAPPLASAAISEACIAVAARFESAVLDYAIIASSVAQLDHPAHLAPAPYDSIPLSVPIDLQDDAKMEGAKWDPCAQHWWADSRGEGPHNPPHCKCRAQFGLTRL